jgi:hypothetical protein
MDVRDLLKRHRTDPLTIVELLVGPFLARPSKAYLEDTGFPSHLKVKGWSNSGEYHTLVLEPIPTKSLSL